MQEIKTGDPLAPVTATHVLGLQEIAGVIFRMEYVTRNDQPLNQALMSPNYILKSAQARALAKSLLDAADGIDGVARAAANDKGA